MLGACSDEGWEYLHAWSREVEFYSCSVRALAKGYFGVDFIWDICMHGQGREFYSC